MWQFEANRRKQTFLYNVASTQRTHQCFATSTERSFSKHEEVPLLVHDILTEGHIDRL